MSESLERRPPDGGEDRLPRRREEAAGLDRPVRTDPPHAARFQFLFGALLAFALAAVAGAVLLVASDDRGAGGSRWSPWQPAQGSLPAGAEEIANHVAPTYKLPSGQQLVAVSGGKLEVAGLDMQIARRDVRGEIDLLEGKGALYRMCGLGAQCSIAQGKPSAQRTLLLRREALELALYSFRYLDGVDDVVVLLPPAKGQAPSQAVHFQRDDLDLALERPLQATLRPEPPGVADVTRWRDAGSVDRLTTPNVACFSLTQANADTRAFLVLEPPPVNQPCPSALRTAG